MKLHELLNQQTLDALNVRYPSAKGEVRVHRVARGSMGATLSIRYGEGRVRGGAPMGLVSSMARTCEMARTFGVKSRV